MSLPDPLALARLVERHQAEARAALTSRSVDHA